MVERITEARVTHARVYTNGCVITCAGTIDLKRGENTVLVDCVAFGAVKDSLRVRLPPSVSLVSVHIANDRPLDKIELEKRIEKYKRLVASIDARIANRTAQKSLWIDLAKDGKIPAGGLADVLTYLERLPAHLDALDDEVENLRNERDRAEEQQRSTQRALNNLRTRSMRGLLQLCVVSTTEGAVPFEVDQRCPHASWTPVYDVIVDSFDRPVTLRMRANVRQQTSLDWRGVRLTLSTAHPTTTGTLKKLQPLRLRKHRDISWPPAQGASASGRALPISVSASPRASADRDADMVLDTSVDLFGSPSDTLVEAKLPQAWSATLANSMEFVLEGTWDVPNEVGPRLVEIQTTSIAASFQWRAIPLMDDSVYMVAVLKEQLPPEAVGHEASVHLMGEYCGKVTLDAPATDEEPQISLGPDARMSVSRTLVRRHKSTTLLRGRVTELMQFELGIRSQRMEPVHLVLIDQLPITEDKDIVVEAGNTGDATVNAETGEVRWELDVVGGTSCSRRFSYTISCPKGVQIEESGSDRTRSTSAKRVCPECGTPLVGGTRFCPACGATLHP